MSWKRGAASLTGEIAFETLEPAKLIKVIFFTDCYFTLKGDYSNHHYR